MDNHTEKIRSYNMSQIKRVNTKPEVLVRKYLFSAGFRYRKDVKDLPGRPDIVLPKYKTVIFVNGCFWHMHEGCSKFVWPSSNQEYWEKKLHKNKQRDIKNIEILKHQGWKVIVIWECELHKKVADNRLKMLCNEIITGKEKTQELFVAEEPGIYSD
ncbi:MAG: DNA mismatch endonuclease Vsr [Syntrophomonadaceae bacterium]|nr:DNA mismatch endonuclease Vsr [Syntrophomonadaceae bacterium]